MNVNKPGWKNHFHLSLSTLVNDEKSENVLTIHLKF